MRRNGNLVDEFSFDRGEVATKVQTGEIEIEINGGNPDGAQIKNGKFTLTEGDRVLVEIVEPPAAVARRSADRQAKSSFDDFDPSEISPYQLKVAGGGDPNRAPPELVAVIGDGRLAHTFGGATDVAFQPNGNLLASTGDDHRLRLWDTSNGQQVDAFSVGGRAMCVAYSPNGSRVAVGVATARGSSANVQIWNSDNRERTLSFALLGHQVDSLLWTPDSARLIGAVRGDSVRVVVWDAATGQEIFELAKDIPGRWVSAIALSPDGKRLATALSGGDTLPPQLLFWDAGSGEFLHEIELGEGRGDIRGLAWSPDGQQIAVGIHGAIQKVLVCDVEAKVVVHSVPAVGVSANVAWSPDGKWLASGTLKVVLWDAESVQTKRTYEFQRETGGYVTQLTFSNDGEQLAATTAAGAIELWDVASGESAVPSVHGHSSQVAGVDISPDGRWIASSSRDRTVRIWDVSSAAEAAVLDGRYVWFNDVAFSPDGTRLAAAGMHDLWVVVWNALSHEKIFVLPSDSRETVDSVVWSPNGKLLGLASIPAYQATTWVKVIDASTGRERYRKDVSGVACLAFSPDNESLAVGDHEHVQIWNASDGEVRHAVTAPGTIRSVAFNPDGTRLLVAGDFPDPLIYNTETGTEVRSLLTDREWTQVSAIYSPDGLRIAALDHANRLSYWDPSSGKVLRRVQLYEEANSATPTIYHRIDFAPDGRHVVVSHDNGTLYVLRMEEHRE